MHLIHAILRPEKERAVVQALERIGQFGLTKWPVTGRGVQGGIEAESGMAHTELVKIMLMIYVDDDAMADQVVTAISRAAYTGHHGDGRIFVSPVSQAVRIRTGEVKIAETVA